MKTEKDLLEQRRAVYETQRDLLERAAGEGRSLLSDEQEQYDRAEADYSDLSKQIEQHRALLQKRAEQSQANFPTGERAPADNGPQGGPSGNANPEYRSVYLKIQRSGLGSLTADERAVALQHRAQAKGAGSAGGFLVPEYWDGELITKMKAYGGMLESATVVRTEDGGLKYFPVVDDLVNEGEIVGENQTMSQQDVPFSQVSLGDHKYSSKIVLVSLELAQDEAYGLENVLTTAFARRLGVHSNRHFTTGDGSNKPRGILIDITLGNTAAAVDGLTFPELIALKHSVDPAYRANGVGRFMLNDQTLSVIKQISIGSGDARPLWQGSVRVGEPDTIDGSQYVINQAMPDLGAGNTPILFGDLSAYHIRMVRGITSFTFREKYMDQGSVGYMAFMRADGRLLDTNAVAKLTNAAS